MELEPNTDYYLCEAGGGQEDWHFPCQFGVQNAIAHTQLAVLMAINFNQRKRERNEREKERGLSDDNM